MKINRDAVRYAAIVLGIVFLALMIMDFNGRMAEYRRLSAESEIIEQRLIGEAQTRTFLETQMAYATSDDAVRQFAYENHMVGPDDQPVVPLQSSKFTPGPTPQPAVEATELSNLEKWWLLLTGSKSP